MVQPFGFVHFNVAADTEPLLQLYAVVPELALYPAVHFILHFAPDVNAPPELQGVVSPPTVPAPRELGKVHPFGFVHFNVGPVNAPLSQLYMVFPESAL